MKALLILTALVAAVAVAAPAALASPAPGSGTFITDTLGGSGHPAQADQGYRFTTDTLGGNGGAPLAAYRTAPGFNWADAGIGAATIGGSLLVLLGGGLLVLRRRGGLAY
jgi:hypothetical protein